jgi:hypothetical protein
MKKVRQKTAKRTSAEAKIPDDVKIDALALLESARDGIEAAASAFVFLRGQLEGVDCVNSGEVERLSATFIASISDARAAIRCVEDSGLDELIGFVVAEMKGADASDTGEAAR